MGQARSFYKPKSPLILLSLFWAIGLFSAKSIQLPWTESLIGWIITLVFFSASFYLYGRRNNFWFLVLLLSFLLFGFQYMNGYENRHQSHFPSEIEKQRIGVQGYIASEPEIDGAKISFQVQPRSYQWNQEVYPLSSKEKVIFTVYLKKETDLQKVNAWGVGNGITFYGVIEKPNRARNPGQFDYATYLHNKDIYWQINVTNMNDIQVSNRFSFKQVLGKIRDQVASPLEEHLTSPQTGFMKSLLLGDREELSSEIQDDFSTLGLSHLIAISGLHLTVFSLILFWILSKTGLTKERRGLVVAGFLIFYMVLVGSSPSVVRATIMALLTLYGLQFQRSFLSLQSIGLTFLLMTLYNPKWSLDIGFQLSFIVTFFLIWGTPKIDRFIGERILGKLRSTLSILVVSQLASFPLVIYYFHQYSLLSWFANLVFVPLFSVIVLPIGLLLLLIGWLPFSIVHWVGSFVDYFLVWLFLAIKWLAKIDHFQFVTHVPLWGVLLLYGLILWFLQRKELKASFLSYRTKKYIFQAEKLVIIILVVVGIGGFIDSWNPPEAKITMIDVGQGDSILIETQKGKTMLIDSGGTVLFGEEPEWKKRKKSFSTGKDIILPYLRYEGIRSIDLAVVTHEDADHIQGFLTLVGNVPIRDFVVGDGFPRTELGEQLQAKLEEYHIPYQILEKAEMEIVLDEHTKATVISLQNRSAAKENNHSLVTFLQIYDTRFALMGDLEEDGEKRLIREYDLQPMDFLKVGHHGSKTSTSPEFLEQLQPREALISVGENNRYRHPSDEVVQRLVENQTRIWRTDQYGAITIEVTPTDYSIEKTLP